MVKSFDQLYLPMLFRAKRDYELKKAQYDTEVLNEGYENDIYFAYVVKLQLISCVLQRNQMGLMSMSLAVPPLFGNWQHCDIEN